MKMRTARVSCLAAALVAATGFGNAAFALDDWKNCGEFVGYTVICSATNSGDFIYPGEPRIFNLFQFSKDQTATLTNIGTVAYTMFIEQGLRTGNVVTLKPGESAKVAPFDNGYFSWSIYAVVIQSVDRVSILTPEAKAQIDLRQFSAAHQKCNADCTTSANGCRQGCTLDPHIGAACLAGCDFRVNICLTNCSQADQ